MSKGPQQHPIRRNDPDPRPVEGALNRVGLDRRDPDKHYVYVSSVNDPTLNPGSYEAMGYTYSQYDPDGAQPILGYKKPKQGDHMEAFGCVLMECTAEVKERNDREGVPGMGLGQKWADEMQKKIRRAEDSGEVSEPLSPAERAAMRGIQTGRRYAGDNRDQWGF